jgi:hypothetical protein
MFICDRQTNRRMPDYHIHMGETFYLIEKTTSPTHYANFASLICSVHRGIKWYFWSLDSQVFLQKNNVIFNFTVFWEKKHEIMSMLSLSLNNRVNLSSFPFSIIFIK